jgi:hypothetical protein
MKMAVQASKISFDAGKDLERMIQQRAKQEGITVSEYIREAIILEMFFSGDVEAMKFVVQRVGKRVKDSLVEKLRHADIPTQVEQLLEWKNKALISWRWPGPLNFTDREIGTRGRVVDVQNTGEVAGGQEPDSGLASKYYFKSPFVYRSKAVKMCESGSHFVVSWDPKNPAKKSFAPFRCRSWRHPGDCQRWKGSQDFVRCRDAMKSRGDRWVYVVLTLDQKHFANEWAAYRGGIFRWQKLNQRLSRRYGRVEYLQTWEKHVRTDFPHVNVALCNARISELCVGDGWKLFRRQLNTLAIACGFGLRIWCEPLRVGQSMTLAGYFTKLSRELTGAGTKNQVPVNAPPHFRRIRASQGLLPPPLGPAGHTGALISAKLLGRVDLDALILGQAEAKERQKLHVPVRLHGDVRSLHRKTDSAGIRGGA